MARKKTHRRRSAVKKVTRRRSRRLGAGMNTANLKGAGMNAIKGLAGGLIFGFIAKLADKDGSKPNNRIVAGLITSAAAGMFLKQPAIAAGIAGATAALVATKIPGLNDGSYDVEFIPPNTLMDAQPDLVYDENGQAFFPLNDGSVFPLNDYQASAYNSAKQAAPARLINANVNAIGRPSGNFQQIYPGYLNPGFM